MIFERINLIEKSFIDKTTGYLQFLLIWKNNYLHNIFICLYARMLILPYPPLIVIMVLL